MLNLHYSRADRRPDWQELLKEDDGHVIFIVPDQATLQTERTILQSLGVPGLIDIEVISFSRFGHRVMSECGGVARKHIDERGRQMLLAKIILERRSEMQIFERAALRQDFVAMMAKLIGEFKQYQTTPDDVLKLAADNKSLLHRKLLDIGMVFNRYEEEIKGKRLDTEDQIGLYTSVIKDSEIVKNTRFWICGFDYYTPRTLSVIEQLMIYAPDVHIMITLDPAEMEYKEGKRANRQRDYEVFAVGKKVAYQLQSLAQRCGIPVKCRAIDGQRTLPEDLVHLEKEMFSYPSVKYEGQVKSIVISACSNYYTEAETAASFIIRQVREENMRFKDIAVICNDMQTRGTILKRVFDEYEIPCFMDQKRSVMHNPYINFIMSLIRVVVRNYRYEDVFALLKTGFILDEWEELENYALCYKINGSKWKREFIYGAKDKYGDDDEVRKMTLVRMNVARSEFIDFISRFEMMIKPCKTAAQISTALYDFLRNEAKIDQRAELAVRENKESGRYEYALEIAQVWNVIVDTVGQAAELVGETEVSLEMYEKMLRAGFEAVEVGIIPPSMDQVIVGTLQRSRIGEIKAVLIVGANDGVWPASVKDKDLLFDHEKLLLLSENESFCKSEKQREDEELLSVYNLLSAPERRLFLSYSVSDIDGKEIRPSVFVSRIRELFPALKIRKDIVNEGDQEALYSCAKGALKYVTEELRKGLDGGETSEAAKVAFNWYNRQSQFSDILDIITKGLFHTDATNDLLKEQVKELYRWDEKSGYLIISPSQLESFSRCPFSHLIRYGIKPEERKIFEAAPPELGEIFHEALLMFSKETAQRGNWKEMVTEDNAAHLMDKIVEDIIGSYKDGILAQGQSDAYRIQRIKRVCTRTASAVAEHVHRGILSFNKFYFEADFGRKGIFKPIKITIPDGETVLIEGRIDRVDYCENDKGTHVKIIDYKSGNESFDEKEAKDGWRLQLMLYLRAAIQGLAEIKPESSVNPAGAFYLHIDDPLAQIDEEEKMQAQIRKHFKMDGVLLHDDELILAMDPEISRYSDILPVAASATTGGFEGVSRSKNQLLDRGEFGLLLEDMEKLTGELCDALVKGSIDIAPKKLDNSKSACTYCLYKTICFCSSLGRAAHS